MYDDSGYHGWMLGLFGLPRHAKGYATSAGFALTCLWWAYTDQPAGPKFMTDMAPVVQILAPVGLALIAIFFLVDWWYERYVRRIRAIGARLLELSVQMMRAETDHERNRPPRRSMTPVGNMEDMRREWHQEVDAKTVHQKFMVERFVPQIAAQMAILHSIGIDAPWIVQTSMSSRLESVAKWLGAMGQLLAMDEPECAKKYGPDQSFWWSRIL